jgi:hypothetical protein
MGRVVGIVGVIWFAAMLLHSQPNAPEWYWALLLPGVYVFGLAVLKD